MDSPSVVTLRLCALLKGIMLIKQECDLSNSPVSRTPSFGNEVAFLALVAITISDFIKGLKMDKYSFLPGSL